MAFSNIIFVMLFKNYVFQECIGQFKQGLIVKPKRGSNRLLAQMYKCHVLPLKELGCLRYEATSSTELIPSSSIFEKTPTIHDCKVGRCRVVEQFQSMRIEQEDILKKSYHLKHNSKHSVYILNQYSL